MWRQAKQKQLVRSRNRLADPIAMPVTAASASKSLTVAILKIAANKIVCQNPGPENISLRSPRTTSLALTGAGASIFSVVWRLPNVSRGLIDIKQV